MQNKKTPDWMETCLCGWEARMKRAKTGGAYYAICLKCGNTTDLHHTPEEAAETWNEMTDHGLSRCICGRIPVLLRFKDECWMVICACGKSTIGCYWRCDAKSEWEELLSDAHSDKV